MQFSYQQFGFDETFSVYSTKSTSRQLRTSSLIHVSTSTSIVLVHDPPYENNKPHSSMYTVYPSDFYGTNVHKVKYKQNMVWM